MIFKVDISNEAIGKRIRQLRTERGFTREQLAEYAEISTDFLSVIEVGKRGMKVQNLARIAAALNVSTDYLIYGVAPATEYAKISAMLSTMSMGRQKQIARLIAVFLDTVRNDEENSQSGKETN